MNPVLERLSQLPLFAQCDLRELAAIGDPNHDRSRGAR